jgi:hypothetical protein
VLVRPTTRPQAPGQEAEGGGQVSGRFRKRPVVVTAERWWPGKHILGVDSHGQVDTLEGIMPAQAGDWIITGVAGEKYPCKHDIFMQTYESVAPEEFAAGLAKERPEEAARCASQFYQEREQARQERDEARALVRQLVRGAEPTRPMELWDAALGAAKGFIARWDEENKS